MRSKADAVQPPSVARRIGKIRNTKTCLRNNLCQKQPRAILASPMIPRVSTRSYRHKAPENCHIGTLDNDFRRFATPRLQARLRSKWQIQLGYAQPEPLRAATLACQPRPAAGRGAERRTRR